MIWIILHFIFLLIPVVVPVALYRNKGRIMTHFYLPVGGIKIIDKFI